MTISKLTPLFCALAIGAIGASARADDNPAQAAARAALANQPFQTNGQPPAASGVEIKPAQAAAQTAAQGEADKNAEAERAALAASLANQTNAPRWSQNTVSNTAAADAKAKKEKKKKKEAAAPAVAAPQTAPATNDYIGRALGLKETAAPALPISAGKEARLQALLEKYKADQLTPEEYHQQRAAILAEP